MDNTELWWKLFQEYASEARHHEQQRATVTGFFSALAAGILTLVGMDKVLNVADLPASLFLVVIGAFGCVFSAKQYERYYVCMERARQYRLAVQEAMPGSKVLELKRSADTKAAERFPRLHSWRLGLFWVALHALIASFGILLVVLSLIGVGATGQAAHQVLQSPASLRHAPVRREEGAQYKGQTWNRRPTPALKRTAGALSAGGGKGMGVAISQLEW